MLVENMGIIPKTKKEITKYKTPQLIMFDGQVCVHIRSYNSILNVHQNNLLSLVKEGSNWVGLSDSCINTKGTRLPSGTSYKITQEDE